MKPSPAFSFFQVCSKFQGRLVETETEEDYERFCKEGKILPIALTTFHNSQQQQFFYIWYQRLFEFLEDAGRRSNTEAPTTWLRYTDNDKVKGKFLQKNLMFVKEGTWVDYSTKQAPLTPIPWLLISEPTGFIGACQLY